MSTTAAQLYPYDQQGSQEIAATRNTVITAQLFDGVFSCDVTTGADAPFPVTGALYQRPLNFGTIKFTGSPNAARSRILPASTQGRRWFYNPTGQTVTVKATNDDAGVALAPGETKQIYWDASGAVEQGVSGLAAVATSGSYNDLDDKPTIPAGESFLRCLPGRWYSNAGSNARGSSTGSWFNYSTTVTKLQVVPLVVRSTITIDRLAVYVSVAGGAGTQLRLGIYNTLPNTLGASTLLGDAGLVDASTAGPRESALTAPLTLAPGTYWFACMGVPNGDPTTLAVPCVTTCDADASDNIGSTSPHTHLLYGSQGNVTYLVPASSTTFPNLSAQAYYDLGSDLICFDYRIAA